MSKKTKRFLDTSVARPIIVGSSRYRQYFDDAFKDSELYTSPYVRMEFRRSYIVSAIGFYFVLDMDTTLTIADALTIWSDRFKSSELKAVLQLMSQLCNAHRLDSSDPDDKPKALTALGDLIKRYEYKLWKYKDVGVDTPRCARSAIAISSTGGSVKKDLKRFVDLFNDTSECRSKCRIDKFILSKHKATVDLYIRSADQLSTNADTKGFKKIAANLELIRSQNARNCTCKMCEKIGDFVIALDSPETMSLEHTDLSFNKLCDLIGKKHQLHPSQASVIRTASATPSNTDE
jgi:hypothetical protein